MSKIQKILAREILDSRGIPTLEVEIYANTGECARTAVPSGISTGENEALELRDGERRYFGKGVHKSIQNIEKIITPILLGKNIEDQKKIDQLLIDLDGTEHKEKLGANTTLAISLSFAKLLAQCHQQKLWQYLQPQTYQLPVPLINILNGGLHANNGLEIQELMIVPFAERFSERLQMGVEIFYALKTLLIQKGKNTAVGDEGGFAPEIRNLEEGLDWILTAIEHAGYTAHTKIALDVAASTFFDPKNKTYHYLNKTWEGHQLAEYWEKMNKDYHFFSLEDPLSENDWTNWQYLTEKLGQKILLVGDDLFVTQKKYLQKGIQEKTANAILIKPNQVGTLSETIEVIELAKKNNYTTILSHRSGETEDTTIADLSVGLNTKYIKTGSVSRSERVAKYNQLLRIEEEIK